MKRSGIGLSSRLEVQMKDSGLSEGVHGEAQLFFAVKESFRCTRRENDKKHIQNFGF